VGEEEDVGGRRSVFFAWLFVSVVTFGGTVVRAHGVDDKPLDESLVSAAAGTAFVTLGFIA
jgi:hypothetical protein